MIDKFRLSDILGSYGVFPETNMIAAAEQKEDRMKPELENFVSMRYGMFVHYGLFSLLGRGEWAMNREGIPPAEMEELARKFQPSGFDAEAICQLAVDGGMKYLIFTTMHHEGFRLYETALTPFHAKAVCGRDLVEEITSAARKFGLKIGLYHSLNNWHDQPDAVAALESGESYDRFMDHTMTRIQELVKRFPDIDILWYDGWWPFDAAGWQAEKMNEMVRKIQPDILFNGRNCLSGDFGTPEQHLSVPEPWRPWEACMTLNEHWGFHRSDEEWKSPRAVIKMLLACANGNGNLLLNIGPRGDGSIPERSVEIVRAVGKWLDNGGREAVSDNQIMKLGPYFRKEEEHSDWDHNGVFSASGSHLFLTLLYDPGEILTLTGIESKIRRITSVPFGNIPFVQKNDKVVIELPEALHAQFCPVLKMECEGQPSVYRTGGMRVPNCRHTRYDPAPSDIQY